MFPYRLFRKLKGAILCALVLAVASSCQKVCEEINPDLSYFPTPCVIESRPSAFPPLTGDDRYRDWGKELRIGYAFALEQDYYRAITSFKRTLVLLPVKEYARKEQVHYALFECYYLAYKYQEAIETFEGSPLENVSRQFPAFRDLLISLYDCYQKIGSPEKANKIASLIAEEFPAEAANLKLSTAILNADFEGISETSMSTPYEEDSSLLLGDYMLGAKSEQRAKMYQAILPGAGYYYVGLKNSAVTSFMLNGLFLWAAGTFFNNGNIAAGLITMSFEAGWYFGGINGAGIAAKEYNERLYEVKGREFMRTRGLFPILMLETTF